MEEVGKAMKILYVSAVFDSDLYHYSDSAFFNQGQAIQRFHSLLIKGILANATDSETIEVQTISGIPVLSKRKLFEKQRPHKQNNLFYYYLPSSRISIFRYVLAFYGTFTRIIMSKNPDTVIVDTLKVFASIGAMFAARIRRVPCIGIVTDLPEDLNMYRSRMMKWLCDIPLKHMDAYVLLAENMKDEIGLEGGRYIVSEGHTDIEAAREPIRTSSIDPPIIMYAGTLDARYGILTLLDTWNELVDLDVRLHIYGGGNVESLVRERAKLDDRIIYFGLVPNDQVLEAECRATLLINPRPSHHRFTKYSFPSKTLEYMASGRPVLMTRLPAMPDEYLRYVWTVQDETSAGFAKRIREILSMDVAEIDSMGLAAQQFVLEEKNSKKQAERILKLIKMEKIKRNLQRNVSDTI